MVRRDDIFDRVVGIELAGRVEAGLAAGLGPVGGLEDVVLHAVGQRLDIMLLIHTVAAVVGFVLAQ